MKLNPQQIIQTEDGSHSVLHSELHETYHSIHGAMRNPNTLIGAACGSVKQSSLNILEIGFGTGLNAFLTLVETEKPDKSVLHGCRALPNIPESAASFNYPDLIAKDKKDIFYLLHTSPWQKHISLTKNFDLNKIQEDFTKLRLTEMYDLIYFDAFSPEKQPGMWTSERFQMLYDCCNPNAILTTYCAKGAVRRALQTAGFSVERIPGAKGKREMLRARKTT